MERSYQKIIFVIQIIVLFPLIFFIIIIWPIFRIKIGVIKSKLVGSIALTPEIYLVDKKFGLYKKNDIILWYNQREVANKYLLEKRKKDLIFLPGYILHPIRDFFCKFKLTYKHVYPNFFYNNKTKQYIQVSEKLRTDQKLLKQSEPFIKFSSDEVRIGSKYLEKNFINKNDKIILFGSRSPFYRDEKYVSVRNSDIKTQIKAMKFVIGNGYKAVRVGRDKINKFQIESKNFFDYTFADHQSDFLDVFIASRGKFMVCGNTGLNELATIMRVPRLIINFSNFNWLKNCNEAYTPIILPKKLFSKSLGKHLTYEEIFKKKFFDANIISDIPKDLQLIDNSEDEILNATKEMINLIDNGNLNFDYERNNQKNFWGTLSKFYEFTQGIIISPSFYKKFGELFI